MKPIMFFMYKCYYIIILQLIIDFHNKLYTHRNGSEMFITKYKAMPAIETLNNRTCLPRRYRMFYDLLFFPGLQKKEYVKELITQKERDRELRFGTCSFEAHGHGVIKQNYFAWLYHILTDHFWI